MDLNASTLYKYDVLHVNIRGVKSNCDHLVDYLKDIGYPEIVMLNETKLSSSSHFHIPGYECVSRREQHRSYGSMILVRSDISNVVEITEVKAKFKNDEILGAEILPSTSAPGIKIFNLYNPPNTKPNPEIFRYLAELDGKLLLAGDLNCKNISWGSTKNDTRGIDLLQCLSDCNLITFNNGSHTRCDPSTGKEESLDLAIGNADCAKIFKEFWVGFDVGSDHYPVHALFQFKSPVSANPLKVRKYEKMNVTKWNHILREASPI